MTRADGPAVPSPLRAMALRSLVPMLPVRHLPVAVDFYERLGFAVEDRKDDWGWALLRLGDVRLMLDQSIDPPAGAPRASVLYLYPDDVAAFHRAIVARGVAAPPPAPTFYGMLEFRLEDPDGNRLWIGQEPAAGADRPQA